MVAAHGCPDASVLEQLALGRMSPDEVERLAEHCERCERCVEALQRLRAEDALVVAMRSQAAAADTALPDKVRDLMESLKGLRVASTGPATVPTSEAGRHAADTLSEPAAKAELAQELHDFLAPAQGPGELGRLGTYRVLKVLGSGGMGIVFLAEDPDLRRHVALKVMRPALAASATARQRFLREAQAMAAVEHDHIVHINQIGQERGIPFLAMAYLEGETLEDRLRRERRLPPAEVVRVGREVAEGLAAAHERGLIHRDIKPANLWLEGKRGRVKILDFGLARAMADEMHLTQPGVVAGTPAYMSPEQGRGGAVDHRSDLFSLGCVLYCAATGEAPFHGTDALSTLVSVATDQPAPPCKRNSAVSPGLSELIMRLLAKKPEERPASAQEVAEALRRVEGTPVPTATAPPASTTAERNVPSVRGAGRRLVAVAAILLALLPLGYFFGGTVIRFATDKGELVIETDDPNVEVTIKGGSAVVYDRVKDRRFVLTAGDYEVQVREEGDDGVKFATRKFTITRGGRETFHARLELAKAQPEKVQPQPPAASVSDPDRRVAEWVLSIGGRVALESDPQHYLKKGDPLPAGPFSVYGIDLTTNLQVTDTDFDRLAELTHLRTIYADDTLITDAALAKISHLTRLHTVMVSHTVTHHPRGPVITDAGLAHLKNMKELMNLGLGGARQVTDAGLANLHEHTKLTDVQLAYTGITDDGLAHLQQSTGIGALSLRYTSISDKGLEHLAGMKNLYHLDLVGTRVTDAGLKHLNGAALKEPNHAGTTVTDAGLDDLARFPKLAFLDLSRTKVTAEGVQKLHRALPQCGIQSDHGVFEPNAPGADASGSPDRRAAEWVLQRGGMLHVRDGGQELEVKRPAELPKEGFKVLDVFFTYDVNFQDVAGLENLAGLKALRTVNIETNACSLTDQACAYFQGMPGLQSLGLLGKGHPYTGAGLRQLESCPELHDLRLEGRLDDAGCAQLGRLTGLAGLNISGAHVTAQGFAHLANLRRLEQLKVDRPISAADLEQVKRLGRLRALELVEVTDEGLVHVGELPNLAELRLARAQVSDVGMKPLARLSKLTTLRIEEAPIQGSGLEHLQKLTSLYVLDLRGSQLTDAGLDKLRALTRLRVLTLNGCSRLTDAGLAHFAALTELEELNLDQTAAGDATLQHLKGLKKLRLLSLRSTQVTDAGVADLKAALPNCRVADRW